jgi:hypothetical protein
MKPFRMNLLDLDFRHLSPLTTFASAEAKGSTVFSSKLRFWIKKIVEFKAKLFL